jgi:hypothetical protein
MKKDLHEEMLSMMAETLPFKILVKQVQMAIDDYLKDPTELSAGYSIFTMQLAMLKHIMESKNITAEQLSADMSRHGDIMNLFKENNN